ncbi:MAG TPA: 50S ribosomal protein L29 [Candidatus Paceibacterota bacterium]
MKSKQDFKNKSNEELIKLIAEKHEFLRVFHFDLSGSKTKNVREGRVIKREIARAQTAISAKA